MAKRFDIATIAGNDGRITIFWHGEGSETHGRLYAKTADGDVEDVEVSCTRDDAVDAVRASWGGSCWDLQWVGGDE